MQEKSQKFYIVGAGPGDPELITVKGQKLLREADVILYTDSLVSSELTGQAKPGAEVIKSSGMTLEEVVLMITEQVKAGKMVVRLHTGDPAVYGAIFEQIYLLRKENIEPEIIPGVSSVFASAAALKAELTIPSLTQTVILTRVSGRTPVPEKEELRSLAAHHCTLAIFLSASLAAKTTRELLAAGWEPTTPIAIVEKASWPDERIIRTTVEGLEKALQEAGIKSHAMILAGQALAEDDEQIFRRSLLYDGSFSHGFRKGD